MEEFQVTLLLFICLYFVDDLFPIVRIHFLDNSSKVFLVNGQLSIKDLLAQCVSKLGIADAEVVLPYFGLFESRNGGSIDGVLAMEMTIQNVIRSWQSAGVDKTAKFLFMLRLQVPSLWGLTTKDVVANALGLEEQELSFDDYFSSAELLDSNVLHVQFIQADPTTQEEGLTLGAIQFILKFGKYKPEKHKSGFLGNRIVEFVPIKLLKSNLTGGKGDDTLGVWEAQLLDKVQSLSAECVEDPKTRQDWSNIDDNEANGDHPFVVFRVTGSQGERFVPPERKYMEIIYSMHPIYGSTFFKCTQKSSRLPETVNLGIHCDGLHIFDKSKKLLKTFLIQEIYRWGFKLNLLFYFEVSADNESDIDTFEFDTIEGKVISELMTDYAMAFLKERERTEERMNRFVSSCEEKQT